MRVFWAWSVGTALLECARRHIELDDDDLDVMVQTVREDNGATHALEILRVDMVAGGSGIVDAFVRDFPRIVQEAVRHLAGHECPASCSLCHTYERLRDLRSAVPRRRRRLAKGRNGTKPGEKAARACWSFGHFARFADPDCPNH